MRWRKIGKVFDPAKHGLPAGCVGFAQSPQALVLPDRLRIYFSSRSIDARNGKYLSHVGYVDMTRDLGSVIEVSEKPVLPLGTLGSFDEHGIFPMSVLDLGDTVYGYTCGWSRRVSVSVETGIGLTISRDRGKTFRRVGDGPILTASLHEPFLVGDGFVRVYENEFHMWYIFGTSWSESGSGARERTYKIGHAVSSDGRNWTGNSGRRIIADRLGPDESQALPSVIRIGDRYHMFFCYRYSTDFRTNSDRGYRIGSAVSDDLKTWSRDDRLIVEGDPGGWDSDMACYPNVFECEDRVYLLYNGNEFGRHGFGAALLVE